MKVPPSPENCGPKISVMACEFDSDADPLNGTEHSADAPPESPARRRDNAVSFVDGAVAPQVRAFGEVQRQVAMAVAPQVRAFGEVQRQVAMAVAPQVRAFGEVQRQVAMAVAPQVRAFGEVQRQVAMAVAPQVRAFGEVQRQVAMAVAPQVRAFGEVQRQVAMAVAPQVRAFGEVQRQVAMAVASFPKIDLRWIETLDRLLPGNLRGLWQELDVVASVALDEGVPLSWIPRTEIVIALIEAGDPIERRRILSERRDDILDDCEAALASTSHEWSVECRSAIDALRQGHFGPAQSHASNILDSIVQTFVNEKPRDLAVNLARCDFREIPLRHTAPYLTLRPLDRAFVQWWPSSGSPPPDHFARHPTAHAVGHAGVFDPHHALVAVMLAVSLTLQFEPAGRVAIGAHRSALVEARS